MIEPVLGRISLKRQWRCPPKVKQEEKEAANRSQESKGFEEVTAMKDAQSTEMEGGLVMCEHRRNCGEEQSPARIKAPPQKKRAVIRLESAETEDCVSGQQGLEELHPERSAIKKVF